MLVNHHIDKLNKLIITRLKGDANATRFMHCHHRYMKKVRNTQEYLAYDEIIDFNDLKKLNIHFDELKNVASVFSSFDSVQRTKLALLVKPGKIYFLAKIYIILRKQIPGNSKQVKVFQNKLDALKWIHDNRNIQ